MFQIPDLLTLVREFNQRDLMRFLTLLCAGKHWSAEKVANVFAPAKETEQGVVDWLMKSGIDGSRHTYSTGKFLVPFLSCKRFCF